MAKRHFWTDDERERAIREVAGTLGYFPSNQKLTEIGRSDLANQLARNGGLLQWSERIGIGRPHSDSDTGWDGERAFVAACEVRGVKAERVTGVKSPFDVLVESVLRVDVKAAKYATYGPCRGWFYRLGKIPQADIVAFWQLDTGNFYAIPWTECPRTNVTISGDGGKYRAYLNNWPLIEQLVKARTEERQRLAEAAA